jgi:hypothetical protein
MKTIDRTLAPPLREIEKITLSKVDHLLLTNGIPVWSINAGTQEVTKIELLFEAGRWQEPRRGVAGTTGKMLLDGTKTKSSQQISETLNSSALLLRRWRRLFHRFPVCTEWHLPSLIPLLHGDHGGFLPGKRINHVRSEQQAAADGEFAASGFSCS